MRRLLGLAALGAALTPLVAGAVQLDGLDVARTWSLRALDFRGNHAVSTGDLRKALVTRARPWFTVWRAFPIFDPIVFRDDLDRLRQLYRSRGYYHARVEYDLELPAAGDTLRGVVYVDEGPAVHVERVAVEVAGGPPALPGAAALEREVPLVPGSVFTQDGYDAGLAVLRTWFRDRAYARVQITKHARVDVARNLATVRYAVDPGPPCVFGRLTVEGAARIDPDVVLRELPIEPGEPFEQSLLDKGRANLVGLNLFRTIRLEEDESRKPDVDVTVHVTEAKPREVRVGVGYDTEEQVRGIATWRDYDFFGDARQLGFSGRISTLRRTLLADFLQPHVPGRWNRTRLLFLEEQEDEDPFTVERTRVGPRLEFLQDAHVTAFAFYRFEYDRLTDVEDAVRRRLPDATPKHGLLSGLGLGLEWNTTDDTLDPSRGWVTGLTVEPVGLGADFSFVRTLLEGRLYRPLVGKLGGAMRVRLGASEPFGDTRDVPVFERFYAGGLNSVRGYGRWRVGPLADDHPLGGKSPVEASVELRHPITDTIGGAVFVDAGQVALRSFDFPVDDLAYGAGFGVRYRSPVGPLRLDLAFPTDPPHGDQHWQVHVSVGATF
jgi:outer membrane protein assembly complex protein YaeT